MVRVAGVDIPDNKRAEIALTYIYGIGRDSAASILSSAKIDPGKKAADLSPAELSRVREIMEKGYKVEGDLRREIAGNIKRLRDINSYRGTRHTRGLPSHGQRTKTNSRTRRGNMRKTMGSGRRSVDKK
jgi:small subunit ribosomal protein S13